MWGRVVHTGRSSDSLCFTQMMYITWFRRVCLCLMTLHRCRLSSS